MKHWGWASKRYGIRRGFVREYGKIYKDTEEAKCSLVDTVFPKTVPIFCGQRTSVVSSLCSFKPGISTLEA